MNTNSTRFKSRLATVVSMATLLSACMIAPNMNQQRESGTPINVQSVGKLVKLKSTKVDVIELFGMPNSSAGMPQMPAGIPGMLQGNTALTTGSDEIYAYRHCKSGTSGMGFKVLTPLDVVKTQKSAVEEHCEHLAVLIGKNEIVKTFAYFDVDPVVQENVSRLVKGKSKKNDVIEIVGSPSSVQGSGNDEVYTYRSCISSVQVNTFSGAKSQQNCKQLTIILDKATEVLKGASFQPYQ